MVSRKSVVVGLIIVLIIGVAIGYFLQNGTLNFSTSSPSNPFSGYTKVTLVVSQPNSVQFGDNVYGLGYAGPAMNPITQKQDIQFSVVPQGIVGFKTYDAIQGATYNDLGLQIVVGEVHSDYLVLYIKSTVP
jgi:hypothetical protein